MNKKKIILCTLSIIFVFTFSIIGSKEAISSNSTQTIHYNYNGETNTNTISLQQDATSNLLVDNDQKDLLSFEDNIGKYDLESVTITRHRQKIKIEYYLGNYNTNELIGSDEGYADYDDYTNDYILDIPALNTKFNKNIPTTYSLVAYDDSYESYIPEYTGSDEPLVMKILVAEAKEYSIKAVKYQNRQGKIQPNPLGQTRNELTASNNYWEVMNLSTSVSAIEGETINLKHLGSFDDTYTAGTRTGNLNSYGYFNPTTDKYIQVDSFKLTSDFSSTIYLGGFYEVDDYNEAENNPGSSNSSSGNASIGFYGNNSVEWKNEKVSETLNLNNDTHKQKLSAYPFHLDNDAFDTPEYELYYVPDNWMLAHKLTIDYNYSTTLKDVPDTLKPDTPKPLNPTPEQQEPKPAPESPIINIPAEQVQTDNESNTLETNSNQAKRTPAENLKIVNTSDTHNKYLYILLGFLSLKIVLLLKIKNKNS